MFALDSALFLLINQRLHWEALDPVMRWLSYPGALGFGLIVSALLCLFILGGSRGRKAVVLGALCVALTDPISVRIVKPLVGRERPSNPNYLISGGRYIDGYNVSPSYPSSHAANMFGVAGILSLAYPGGQLAWFAVAGAVGYSRIYLGQHFPGDVLGGALLGLIAAGLLWMIAERLERIMRRRKHAAGWHL